MREIVGRVARAGFAGLVAVLMISLAGASPAGASVPGRPSGAMAVVSGADGLSVSFLAPSSTGGKAIKGYRATCASDTGGVSRTVAGSASPIRVGSLTRGGRYRCVVGAVNADGVGPVSIGSPFVFVPGPPSKPYGLVVSQAYGPRLRVAFRAPVSDGTSAITEYQARCVSGTTSVVRGTRTVSPVLTAAVQPGLTYRCAVRAVNAYGTGLWSGLSAPLTVAYSGDVVVAAGAEHACALRGGAVKCWGYNVVGQLGLGDTSNRGDAAGEMGVDLPVVQLGGTATAITAGYVHTCALLDNDAVKCWGHNDNGQLGLGDTAYRGDAAGEMGATLPTVDLGPGHTAKAITAGYNHTCALLDDDTVKCWGYNLWGQLGLGDNAYRGDAAGEMGAALPTVDLGPGHTARALTAGAAHTCALLDDTTVKCWGYNLYGQLGLGTQDDQGNQAGEMGAALPTVDLGPGRTAKALTAGNSHTCAVLDDDTVKCWGWNDYGQLGLGDTLWRGEEAGEMGSDLPTVNLGHTAKALTGGWGLTCGLLDDDTVKCWGRNDVGQSGLGDTSNRGDGAGEMGLALPTVDLWG